MEKANDIHDGQLPTAPAPSYDEAMKCSSMPPDQMMPYRDLLPMQSTAPPQTTAIGMMPVMPMVMQPPMMMQPQMAPVVQQPPPAAPQPSQPALVQTINIGGVGGLPATCPSCNMPLRTRVGYTSTCSTHCGFLLCCFVGFICCAPFVYCTKCCREPRLKCTHCDAKI